MDNTVLYLALHHKYDALLQLLQESNDPISNISILRLLFDSDSYQDLDVSWDTIVACYVLLTQKFKIRPTMKCLIELFESINFLYKCEWDPKFGITDSKDFVSKLLSYFSVEELNTNFTFSSLYHNLAHCIACQAPDYLLVFRDCGGDIFVRIDGKNLLEYAVRSLYVSMDTMEQLYLSGLDIDRSLKKFIYDERLSIQRERLQELQRQDKLRYSDTVAKSTISTACSSA